MAKGLGAILAAIEIERKKRCLEGLEAPACPLCGEPMTNDGNGWFCYQTERNQCPRIKEAQEKSGKYRDEFQGMTLAAIVDEDESRLLAELKTVRGPYGKTNLCIWPGEGVDDEDIPELAKEHGWLFMEWMEDGRWAAQTETPDLVRVILSSPLALEDGILLRETITLDKAREWVEEHKPDNFSGHQTTKIVGVKPDKERRTCKGYDEALVLQPEERLEWGKEYTTKEIEEIGVKAVLMTKVA